MERTASPKSKKRKRPNSEQLRPSLYLTRKWA